MLVFRSATRHFPSVAARGLVGAESDGSVVSDDLKWSKTFKFAYVWSSRPFELNFSRTSRCRQKKKPRTAFWKIKKKKNELVNLVYVLVLLDCEAQR